MTLCLRNVRSWWRRAPRSPPPLALAAHYEEPQVEWVQVCHAGGQEMGGLGLTDQDFRLLQTNESALPSPVVAAWLPQSHWLWDMYVLLWQEKVLFGKFSACGGSSKQTIDFQEAFLCISQSQIKGTFPSWHIDFLFHNFSVPRRDILTLHQVLKQMPPTTEVVRSMHRRWSIGWLLTDCEAQCHICYGIIWWHFWSRSGVTQKKN